ncbi:mechanosensitive ion channel family protein [Thermoproteota archaeon]
MLQEILQKVFFENTVQNYLIALGAFLIGCIVLKITQQIVIGHLKKFASRTKTTIDDFAISALKDNILPFAYFAAFYFSSKTLTLTEQVNKGINIAGILVLTIFVARLILKFINYGVSVYLRKSKSSESFKVSINGIMKVLQFLVWAIAIIFFLDNMGFKISAVIAGLGIGGIAVALAAQAVLGDLFSYFAILFDRPFEVGDFIIVGDMLGVVEHVGIKTTRISSLGGEQLIFANTDLTNSRVRNYKRMKKRRVVFKLGVTYDTPLEKLQAIPKAIENIIKGVADTTFDRAHFSEYGDFNLVIEIVYYITGSDYNKYMDIQQEINFAIKKEFEARKIEFAFPTQTLYVNKSDA